MKHMYKNIFRNIIALILIIGISSTVKAQQEALTTQYMFNGLSVNPAYAGTHEDLSLTGIIRSQWVGLSGSPNTQVFSIHAPLRRDKVALGLNIQHDYIGVTGSTVISPSYAYRLHFENDAILSMGVQASFINHRSELTALKPENPGDASFAQDENIWLMNFGFGMYYYTDKFYVGASIPSLMDRHFSKNDVVQAKMDRHYYINAGYVFDLDKSFKLMPNAMIRYAEGTYATFDLGATLYYDDLFGIGLSYRAKESVSALFQLFVNEELIIGYAFDYVLSDLRMATYGSHEIMVNYRFAFNKKRYISPRYF